MTKQDQHKDDNTKSNDFSVCYNNHSIMLGIGKWKSRTRREKLDIGINKLAIAFVQGYKTILVITTVVYIELMERGNVSI